MRSRAGCSCRCRSAGASRLDANCAGDQVGPAGLHVQATAFAAACLPGPCPCGTSSSSS